MPTGMFTVRRYTTIEDAFAQPHRSDTPSVTVTVAGRVRTNAEGVHLDLDPAGWPAASVPLGREDVFVTVEGPDTDSSIRTWVILDSSLRHGYTSNLDALSYVDANCRRDD